MTIVGSGPYMAPEVKTGKYNCQADIFSLGVTLIDMYCDENPFAKLCGSRLMGESINLLDPKADINIWLTGYFKKKNVKISSRM